MVRRRIVAAGLALLAAGCTVPMSADPLGDRPYLVAVDALDDGLDSTLEATVVVERDCVLLEDADGLLLPLFSADPTRFGPRDGGPLAVDTGATRIRAGQQVRVEARRGEVDEGVRSRYPGVDTTRCGVRRYAVVGEVLDGGTPVG